MDLPEFAKDNWPYIAGGIIGIYLIYRFTGGNSSDSAAFYSAQAAQANAAAQAGAQNLAAQTQRDMAMAEITLSRDIAAAQGNAQYMIAQANLVEAVGKSSSQTMAALYSPTIAALNSAPYENAAALLAASESAVAGMSAQAKIAEAAGLATLAVGNAASAWGPVTGNLAGFQQKPDNTAAVLGAVVQLASLGIQ